MNLSSEARIVIGIMIITLPTIEFGGTFLLSQLRKSTVIKSDTMGAYFRAGHAHAGVLVILGIIAQLLIDTVTLSSPLTWGLRIGFFAAPVLISAGFFGGAPVEGKEPRPLIRLVYAGALVLAISTIGLGLAMVFGL
jgi:hypothetical protein